MNGAIKRNALPLLLGAMGVLALGAGVAIGSGALTGAGGLLYGAVLLWACFE